MVVQKLATAAPGATEAGKRLLGEGLSRMLAEASTRAVSGAVWNAIVTITVDAFTSSDKCLDACASVEMRSSEEEYSHACEIVGKRRNADGTLIESSVGACEV